MEWWKKLRKYSFSQLTESIWKYFKWTTQEMKLCSISWCIIVRSDSNIWSAVWRSGRLSDGVVGRVWAGSDALQTLLLLPDIPSDRLMLLANQVIWHQTPNRKTITEEVEFRGEMLMKWNYVYDLGLSSATSIILIPTFPHEQSSTALHITSKARDSK